jgi:O-antigen/teichoic acid export membrane protein
LIGILIGLIILILKYQKYFSLRDVDIFVLKDLLNYSSPIVLSSFGIVMAASFDRLMVGSYVGMQELGYYAVATRLSAIVGLFYYVISTAMTPVVYREHKKPETKIFIANIFKLTCCFSVVLLVMVIFYSRSIVTFFAGDEFSVTSEYLFYVIASSVLSGLYIFFLGMDIAKKTKLLSKINLSFGLLSILISFILIPLYGVWGAVISALLISFVRLVGYVYFSQKLYKIPVSIKPFCMVIISLIAFKVLVII